MPKQINTYQVGQSLVRLFGLKGRFQPVLDEVIVPVVLVGESSPQSVRLGAGGKDGAIAGAGNQNVFIFRNPPNSGVLVTVKSWWAVSGAPLTDFVSLSTGTASTAAGDFMIWRDKRIAGVPAARLTRAASPVIVLNPPVYHLDSDDVQKFGDWILGEGDTLSIRQDAANTTLDVTFQWQETDITASLGA